MRKIKSDSERVFQYAAFSDRCTPTHAALMCYFLLFLCFVFCLFVCLFVYLFVCLFVSEEECRATRIRIQRCCKATTNKNFTCTQNHHLIYHIKQIELSSQCLAKACEISTWYNNSFTSPVLQRPQIVTLLASSVHTQAI